MSRIHFVGGEKGGVGKSLMARVLSQWFIDKSSPFAGIDADTSHTTLLRSYGESTQPVDLEQLASADEIANRALANERSVVVDLPAQSGRALDRWMSSADVAALCREAGVGLTLWHVTDGTYDSVRDLEKTMARRDDPFAVVAVKNYGRAKDFSQFDESEAGRRLNEIPGRILELPELESATMSRIDRSAVSFWAAIHNPEGHGLSALQRRRVRTWLDRCYDGLGKLREVF
jgi:hypothetical protein